MITKKYYKLIRVSYEDSEYFRLKNTSNETGVFQMKKQGNPTAPNLEYSLDGVSWTTYDFTNLPEVQVVSGANIYFRGTNANQQFNTNNSYYVYFSFSKTCEGHGNLCSLFDTDPTVFSAITSIGSYGLYSAFQNCTSLTQAPDLSNVTSIGREGLNYAFSGCTSLTQAPDLSNVTSIGREGLDSAFQNCTSLTQAPDLSNVTSIGINGLNYAFQNCTSLTQAPDLSNVTSIESNGLRQAFQNCTHIETVTAPNISDLTVNNILSIWLQGAGTQVPSGTQKVVRVPTGATIATDSISGIPTGWVRVDY